MMKRIPLTVVICLSLAVLAAPFALAATSAPRAAAKGGASPVLPMAAAVSTVTGIAISPLLGTGAYGAYQWFTAKDDAARAALPWYSQMSFWLPALLVVAVCAAKDTFGAAVPPGLKKPLDVVETIENKFSGLIAAGAVIPFTMDTLSKMLIDKTSGAEVVVPSGLAMIHFAAFDLSWLLNLLTVPIGIAVFATVWMASHAINVLILLSPWGAIDAALKGARTALLGLLVGTSAMNPMMGAFLSLIVIVIAYFVSGWAFRLTIFGSVFSWDYLTLRRTRFSPRENDNKMFAGANFPGVPVRSYGRLVQRTAGGLEFVYRPWLFLAPRMASVPAQAAEIAIDRGLIFSDIVAGTDQTLFTLPPRYDGHEATMVRAYRLGGGVRDAGLRKAWSDLREMLGGRAMKEEPVSAPLAG